MSTGRDSERTRSRGRPISRFLGFGLIISGVISLLAFACMLAIAIRAVATGHGLDSYRTAWLVEDHWIGFLTFCAAAVIAMAIAGLLHWRRRRQWQMDAPAIRPGVAGQNECDQEDPGSQTR